MEKKITKKIILSIFLFLLVLLILAGINFYVYKIESTNHRLTHTHQVLQRSEKILAEILDVDASINGFLITRDPAVLRSLISSEEVVVSNITTLSKLARKDAAKQKNISLLKSATQEKFGLSNRIAKLHGRQGIQPFYLVDSIKSSLLITEKVRKALNAVKLAEISAPAAQHSIKEMQIHSSAFFFFFSLVSLISAVFFAYWYFNSSFKTRGGYLAQLNSKLSIFTKRIDDVIRGIRDPFFALDQSFNFIYLNDAMQNVVGIGKGNLIGNNIFELFPQYKDEVMGKKMEEAMHFQKSQSFELFDDFIGRWQDVSIYPTSEGISVYMKDATERKLHEKALQTTQRFLEETNSVASVGGWELDLLSNTVTWTSVTAIIHETPAGYQPDLKSGILFYKEGKSRDTIVQLVNEAIEHGKEWDAELEIVTAKGNEKWIRTKGKPEFENGECIRIFGIFQDVDLKKKMADNIRLKERRFRSAFENPVIGMSILHPDSSSIEVNEALCHIIGYSKEELMLTSLHAITHPEDKILDISMRVDLAKDSGKAFQYEKRYIHRKGHAVWVQLNVSAVTDAEGIILYHIAQIQDISAKKEAQQKLYAERKFLQDIIDNLPMNILVKDVNFRRILVNRSEMTYAQASHVDDLLGKNDFELSPSNNSRLFLEEDKEVLRTKTASLNKETNSVKPDGTITFFLTSRIPLFDDHGVVTGLLVISYQTNELNRIFIQQSPNAIAMFDKEMCYMAASKKWIQDYQLQDEVIGKSHYELSPAIGEEWKKVHQQALSGKISTCEEARLQSTDGSIQWITWDVRPWYLSEGKIGGVLIYTADITLTKEKDQERRKIEEILDKTNDVARIGTWEVDLIKNTVSWSRITREIHEVPEDYKPELVNAINFFKEGPSREKILTAVSRAVEDRLPYDLELELMTAKGNLIWVRSIGQPEFENGVCLRLYGVFQDINKAKQSRDSLQKLNGELNALLNSGYVSIIGTNTTGLITHFNKGAELLLQYSAAEMIGIQTPRILHQTEEIVKRGKELSDQEGREISGFDVFVEKAKQGDYESREWTYVRKDGTCFPVQLVVTAIRDEEDQPIGYLGIGTDISNIKKVEKDLLESNKSVKSVNEQLNQKNEELEQFAYVAAHDLQAPLRNITGFLSLLEQKYNHQLDERAREFIQYSVDGASKMRDIIRDILAFSKSGVVSNVQLDLNRVVAGIIKSYQRDERYKLSEIRSENLPVINADSTAIEQLFVNIIGNGLKYQSANNIPVIKITVEDLTDKWLFKVSDNGIGIDPKHYDKVFTIFKRLHTSTEYSGTGIGLATCKKIVSLYNGNIWIEANLGTGSIFCFTLAK